MQTIKSKNLANKASILALTFIIAFSSCTASIIRAQDLPTSFPVSFPEAQTQELSQPEQSALDNVQNKFDGFSQDEIADATAKVREALIQPAEDNFFVVKFKDKDSADRVSQEVAPGDVIDGRYTSLLGDDTRLIKIDTPEAKVDQMTRFNLDNSVEYVETNQIVKKETWTTTSTTAKPNDFNDANHWYHLKTKLAESYKDQGCSAGTNCGSSSSVIIAILDTGMAFETNTGATYREYLGGPPSNGINRTPLNFTPAPELTGINIWTNPSENYTGQDEDGNFICDDLHGADMIAVIDNLSMKNASQWADSCNNTGDADHAWVEKEGHPNDDDGHGTFVANMIASLADNATSSFGAAFKATIMPIKVLDYTGTGTTFTIAQGIRYAVNKGAKILNISIAGLTTPSATLEDAISYAKDAGVIIIVSSGNQHLSSLEYPAAYTNSYDNVIAVGSSTNTDTKASYSSYGTGLDLVAPVGEGASAGNAAFGQTFNDADAWSSTPVASRNFTTYTNKYWIGTSFAAPQVTAAAAIMKAVRPDLTSRIKVLLDGTATDIGSAGYDVQTGNGILNIQSAVAAAIIDEGDYPSGLSMINSVVFNNKIYQVAKSVNDRIYIRNYNGSSWSLWKYTGGESPGQTSLTVYNNKLYMTVRGGSMNIFTNVFDGVNFSGWAQSGGATPGEIASIVYNGKLYQAIRGKSTTIFTRSFDGNTWTGWLNNGGETPGEISMTVFNNRIVLTVRGGSSNIFSNIYDGVNFTGWSQSGGATPGNISSIVFNGKLYQAIRGGSTTIFYRSYDGSTWGPWFNTGGSGPGEVSMAVYGNKLYMTIRGGSSNIYVDTFDGTNLSGWTLSGGATPLDISSLNYGSLLYQFIRGGSSSIYWRWFNGGSWSGWQVINGNIDFG